MAITGTATRHGWPRDAEVARFIRLSHAAARDPGIAGAKAANLARSLAVGLPVLPGFVVTTQGTSDLERPARLRQASADNPLYKHWRDLSADGRVALAVRSSSVAEDSTTSSMAGRFVSVLHVRGWEDFVDALGRVIDSAASTAIADAPMAVLVQPMASARVGGVLFGRDPFTGSRSHLLVSVAEGLPDQIVSGDVTGTSIVMSRQGRISSVSGPQPELLSAADRRDLARLARLTERVFHAPQDIEWLIEPDGALRLLQSRPITASAVPMHRSHPLGPGPVAETFPDPLSPLERDLWEPPLEAGLRGALRLSGAVGERVLSYRLLVDVGGRVAVDLEVLGILPRKRNRLLSILDPRPPYRRLRAAWRVSRLRLALPAIASDLAAEVDADLADVPALSTLDDHELLTILRNAGTTLLGLHAYEVLAGMFLGQDTTATTGASIALATVARDRLDGLSDEEIITRHPVSLALVPPRIGGGHGLPQTPAAVRMPVGADDDATALAREAMRLRVRWVHELMARVALEIGGRLTRRGQLREPEEVRAVSLDRLRELVNAPDLVATIPVVQEDSPPLPAVFRLAIDGGVIADASRIGAGPQGVSAGRAQGRVTHDPGDSAGAVLVVPALRPDLAGVLPKLAGLVAQTGSPLSHLAILAREYHVPTVVGALDGFIDGQSVIVDGSAGSVEVVS